MATGMHMDKRNADCLVLGHHDQDRKVSAKSVTMRAMTLCKNLSGYRELFLSVKRSDKKNAPLFKCLEKRQEKCATFQEKLLHFKCQEKRQEKCSTFQVSR